MTEKQRKTNEWRKAHREQVRKVRKAYYTKTLNELVEPTNELRRCKCGTIALFEEDLSLFVIDKGSKHKHRNTCLKCHAAKARDGKEVREVKKQCSECKEVFRGELVIERAFRRAKPTGGRIIGNLVSTCRSCEFPEELYYEIEGKFILKDHKQSANIFSLAQSAY